MAQKAWRMPSIIPTNILMMAADVRMLDVNIGLISPYRPSVKSNKEQLKVAPEQQPLASWHVHPYNCNPTLNCNLFYQEAHYSISLFLETLLH